MRDAYLDDTPLRQSTQRQEGLWQHPSQQGKNTTLIASMTLKGGMGEAMCVEGVTTEEVFEAYVEHFLAPSLKEGQVVVLDNLGAHKGEKVRKLIEDRQEGRIKVPDAPGLGIRLDREKMEEYAELYRELGGYPYDRDPGHPGRYALVPKQRFADPNASLKPTLAS